ncbi:hypothetical protein SLA2020_182420 [Shorea laevis]
MAMLMFSKCLRKTDIGKRMSFPTKALKCLPGYKEGQHMVEFQVRDEEDRVWTFYCSTRRKQKHPKPVLSKGWRRFVCLRNLKIGDRVEFYKEEEKAGGVGYHVRVKRPVIVFGAMMGHAPISCTV